MTTLTDGLPLDPRAHLKLGLIESIDECETAMSSREAFALIRGEQWRERAGRWFDPRPPALDASDRSRFRKEAWDWCRSAWTALFAPQLVSVGNHAAGDAEPFTFGYLSGAASVLVDFLEIGSDRWLASSIIVGLYADVFGEDALFEAQQLCAAMNKAGKNWPTASRTNHFEAGWKAGYIEMVDLLSGESPVGLLGRFLRHELDENGETQ